MSDNLNFDVLNSKKVLNVLSDKKNKKAASAENEEQNNELPEAGSVGKNDQKASLDALTYIAQNNMIGLNANKSASRASAASDAASTEASDDANDDASTRITQPDGTVIETSEDGKTIKKYNADGTLRSTIINQNESEYPQPCGGWVDFSDSVSLEIKDRETATIQHDGTVVVISSDRKTVKKYNADGTLKSKIINQNTSEYPQPSGGFVKFSNTKSLEIKDRETATIQHDGTVVVTSFDGKTVRKYTADGTLKSKIVNQNTSEYPQPSGGFVKFSDTKSLEIKDKETATIQHDGTVIVTSEDEKTVKKYSADGTLKSTIVNQNESEYPQPSGGFVKFSNTKSLEIKDKETAVIQNDGTVVVTSEDGETVNRYSVEGTLEVTGANHDESEYPRQDEGFVKFSDTKSVEIKDGETAAIQNDGTVVVTSSDGKTVRKYTADGTLKSKIVNQNTSEYPQPNEDFVKFSNTKSLEIKDGEIAAIHNDGTVIVTSADGKTVRKYTADGTLKSKIVNQNTAEYPQPSGGFVKFSDTKSVEIKDKETATIQRDGTVIVTSEDEKIVKKYSADGTLKSTIVNQNESEYPQPSGGFVKFSNTKSVEIKDNETATIQRDGTVVVTSADGKTIKNYNTQGKLASSRITSEDGETTERTYTYNADGTYKIEVKSSNNDDVTVYNMDQNGRSISSKTTKANGEIINRTYVYNADGSYTRTDVNERTHETKVYNMSKEGHLISERS